MESLKLAVAYDEAFCFYYRENFRELERAGLELVFFSPVRGDGLPEDVSGLYIGGGYPELHAKKLAENKRMLVDIKQHIDTGIPVIAECGGFMYLTNCIRINGNDCQSPSEAHHSNKHLVMEKINVNGNKANAIYKTPATLSMTESAMDVVEYEMCGVFDAVCENKGRLVRFGYVEISDETGLWLNAGEHIKGHEFHYYDTDYNGDGALVRKASTGKTYNEIHITDTIWAGWPHLYFLSNPKFAKGFAEKCARYSANR